MALTAARKMIMPVAAMKAATPTIHRLQSPVTRPTSTAVPAMPPKMTMPAVAIMMAMFTGHMLPCPLMRLTNTQMNPHHKPLIPSAA